MLLTLHVFFFFLISPFLEDVWGRIFYPALLLLSIFLTAIVAIGFGSDFNPIIGSAGVISILLGSYAIRFFKHSHSIHFFLSHLMREPIKFGPWIYLPIWVFGQFALYFFQKDSPVQGKYPFLIQLFALLLGGCISLLIMKLNVEKRIYSSPFDKLPLDHRYDIQITQALEMNEPKRAFHVLSSAIVKFPLDLNFVQKHWDQAVRLRIIPQAIQSGFKLMRHQMMEGDFGRAYYHWCELTHAQTTINIPKKLLIDLIKGLPQQDHLDQAEEVIIHTLNLDRTIHVH